MSKRIALLLTISAALLGSTLSPPVATAAEDAHGAAQHAGEATAEKPALLDWDLGTAFWSIIVFVILLTILRFTAWKPILDGLQQREKYIQDSLASAKQQREEAESLVADHIARLEKARDEATAIVDEGRRDAEEMRKRIQAEAKAEAQDIAERAKRDIGLARDDAVKQLHDEVIVLAASVAGKMIHREVDADEHKSLLDESLAELGRMNN